MLRGIQKASTGGVGKFIMTVVLGALALSFAIWGIGDIFRGFGRSALAQVGRTEIGIEQFRQLYTDKVQQLGRQYGRTVTMDQARSFGYDRQVLGELMAETALDERARQMGLNISDADVAAAIRNDPNFRGPGGFDRGRFESTIRQNGFTEQRYVSEQRKVMLRRQIINTVAGDVSVPKAAIEAAYRFGNEERSIDYVVLDRSQAGTIPPLSPEDLTKYYEERKNQFRTSEYRKAVLVVLTPAEIAAFDTTVTDEEARKDFEVHKGNYATPELRRVQQIVFPNADEAKAAAEKIAQGTAFEAVAKERGMQDADIDLGMVTKSTIIDNAVADAAFALKENEVSTPIEGRFGTALVRVTQIQPGTTKTYEEVAPEIKKHVALDRAKAQVSALRDKIEDARAGGETLAEAAEKLKLAMRSIEAVDRGGATPEGVPVSNLPKPAELVPALFATDVGVENDPLQYENGYIWYDVVGTTPARERTLDEVKNEIEIRYTNEEIAKRLKAKGDELVEKLKAGGSFKDVAAADQLTVQEATGVKRSSPTENLSAPALNAIFRTPKDAVGSAEGVQPTQRVVFRVNDIKLPDLDVNSPDAKRIAEFLRGSFADDLLSGYGERLEKEIGFRINEAALNQVSGGAPAN